MLEPDDSSIPPSLPDLSMDCNECENLRDQLALKIQQLEICEKHNQHLANELRTAEEKVRRQEELLKLKAEETTQLQQSLDSTSVLSRASTLGEPFSSLGPMGLIPRVYPDEGIQLEIYLDNNLYRLTGPQAKLDRIISIGLQEWGSLSPLSEVTLTAEARRTAGIPRAATKFAFLYPLSNAMNTINDERVSEMLPVQQDSVNAVLLIGGYAYFSAANKLLSVNAIAEGTALVFGGPREFSIDVQVELQKQGRLQPVTAAHLRKKRERPQEFAWLGPKDPLINTEAGCFAYVCGGAKTGSERKRIYFEIVTDGASGGAVGASWQAAEPAAEGSQCVVCSYVRELLVFTPCNHQHVCAACADELVRCPICMKDITDKLRVFSD